jgi:hypothetical protein
MNKTRIIIHFQTKPSKNSESAAENTKRLQKYKKNSKKILTNRVVSDTIWGYKILIFIHFEEEKSNEKDSRSGAGARYDGDHGTGIHFLRRR